MAVWVRPAGDAPISQVWGNGATGPNGAGGHPGTDYAAGMGSVIVAASDGVVIWAGFAQGFGNDAVAIWHPADGVSTTYGHFQRRYVNVGAVVRAGQPIGEADNAGYSFGSHLHFEVRIGYAAFGGNPPNVNSDWWLRTHSAYGATPPPVFVVTEDDPFMSMPTINVNGPLYMAHPDLLTLMGLLEARGAWIAPKNRNHAVLITAVHWFQQSHGIAVDGIVGPKTWLALGHPVGSNAK